MTTSLSCPLCSLPLSPSNLVSHLRQELNYAHLRCRLCLGDFTSREQLTRHFAGPLSEHPGEALQCLYLQEEPEKEARLLELVRLAEGGQREVEKRLCVCGQCQLVCREDFRSTSGGRQEFPVENHLRPDDFGANVGAPASLDSMTRAHTHPLPIPKYQDLPVEARETEAKIDHNPSEQEHEVPMDVKPDLRDLKPQISTDGKVACVQCGLRVLKGFFKQHAIGAHSTARPFSCNLCPHNEKTKGALAKHQLKDHGTEMTDESFTFFGSEAKIKELTEQCFGEAQNCDWARVKCMPCDKLVNKKDVKTHACTVHLRKSLHSCKLCPYTSKRLSAGQVNDHVKKVHKGQPGPETVDSSQAQHYAPIISNMIPQLFTK